MKSLVRNALIATAGLVILSLPASALTPSSAGDTSAVKNSTTTAKFMQMARDENPGGAGYKKKKKKMKKAS